jgi:DNA repair protein RadC
MRLPKTEKEITIEVLQILLEAGHDKLSIKESLHSLVSQRETLVSLCNKQNKELKKLTSSGVENMKIPEGQSPPKENNYREIEKLYRLVTNAIGHK